MKLSGTITAMITPFDTKGEVDYGKLKAIVEEQVAAGVEGICAVGTTGESPTLSHEEHHKVIEKTIEFANGKVTIVAGTGANSTSEAISLTKAVIDAGGADASLQVTPYYNKATQGGLIKHFSMIADAATVPLIMYNVPSRTGVSIAPATYAILAEHPMIAAIKEAGGSVERVNQLVQALPADFAVLSGDDGLTVPFISCGAVGVVSVTSNVAPAEMKQLVDTALSGDGLKALELQKKYYPLMKGLMSLDGNPVPIKAAMALRGDMSWEIRLPLVALAEEKHGKLADLLKNFNLL